MNAKSTLLSLLVLIIVAAGLIYWFHPLGWGSKRFSSENVTVKTLNLGPSGELPAGFPADLPLDRSAIVEQSEQDYTDRGVTLYSVSYRSPLPVEELYAEYQKYFADTGYTVTGNSKSMSVLDIEAAKGQDTFLVVITPDGGSSLIKLAVTHH